jgi:hypothetical protein
LGNLIVEAKRERSQTAQAHLDLTTHDVHRRYNARGVLIISRL